jgi:hypothetical protein
MVSNVLSLKKRKFSDFESDLYLDPDFDRPFKYVGLTQYDDIEITNDEISNNEISEVLSRSVNESREDSTINQGSLENSNDGISVSSISSESLGGSSQTSEHNSELDFVFQPSYLDYQTPFDLPRAEF